MKKLPSCWLRIIPVMLSSPSGQKKIKSDKRTKIIPVVLLTSSKEDKDIVVSYRLRVNSYIVKPGGENFVKAVSGIGLYWLLISQLPE